MAPGHPAPHSTPPPPTGSWSGTRRSFPKTTRRRILERDDHRCVRCAHHDATGRTLVADHIVPVAEGGTDDVDNGQTLCVDCHDLKTRAEIRRGIDRRPAARRPRPRHPGLIEPK